MKTTPQILARLGESVKAYRLSKNLTRELLAEKSGSSLSTIKKIESGKGCDLALFIDVMRGLSRLTDFDFVLPEIKPSPMQLLSIEKGRSPSRLRASRRTRRGNTGESPAASLRATGE